MTKIIVSALKINCFLILVSLAVFGQNAPTANTCDALPAQNTERTINGGEVHCYRVELSKDQFLQVQVEQTSADVALKFTDANGKTITEIDSPNGIKPPEILSLVASETAAYRLEIAASEKDAPKGVYVLTREILREATETDRQKFEAQAVFTQAKTVAPAEALALFQKSAELFRKLNDKKGAAGALTEAGFAALGARNGAAALKSFQDALALYQEIEDRRETAKLLKYVAYIYGLSGNSAKALEKYEQAIPLFDPKDAADKADALEAAAIIYLQTTDYKKALEYFTQAAALFKDAREYEREAGTINNIGLIYMEIGRKQAALEQFETALSIAEKNNYEQLKIVASTNKGRTLDDLGKKAEARKAFNEALTKAKDKKARAPILLNLGKVEFELNEREKSVETLKEALKLFQDEEDKFGVSRTFNAIGRNYSAQGDKAQAAAFYNFSLKLQKQNGFKRSEAATLNNLMSVWRAMNNRRLAIFYGKMSVNLFQQIRANIQTFDDESQRSFEKTVADTYRRLAAFLIEEKRLSEAQEVLILLKGEEFFQYTRRSSAVDAKPRQIELNAEETEAAEAYKLLKEDADFIKFSEEQSKKFAQTTSEKRGAIAVPETKKWQNKLAEAGAGNVLLTTLVGDERFYVIITTATVQTAQNFDIKQTELNAKIKQARNALENPRSSPLPVLRELYAVLIKPLETDLKSVNAKNLLWSLDGELRYLSFAALNDGEKYLTEKYANAVVTLAQTPQTATAAPKNWRALGAGVGTKTKDFKPLPNVADELKTVVRDEQAANETGLFTGKRLFDQTFSRTNLITTLKEDFQLIHLATHFVFSPGKDVDSFLLLGNDEKLNLAEIRIGDAFDLAGTDLITLSACETALDEPNADGAEIEGFGVIVQRRGAKSVLASLWSVADDSTRRLMIEFYRQYQNGNISKAEALQKAQIAVLKGKTPNAAHPAYWAAFTVTGDWR